MRHLPRCLESFCPKSQNLQQEQKKLENENLCVLPITAKLAL